MKTYFWWCLKQKLAEPWNQSVDWFICILEKMQINCNKRPYFPRKMDGGFYSWTEIKEFHKRMIGEKS